MNPWIMPMTCAVGSVLSTFPGLLVVHMQESQEKVIADHYLSNRIEDVPIEQISEHVKRIDRDHQFYSLWVEPEVRAAHADFPDGTIFFFNTSKEQWRRLGAEAGYAIIVNGRIVWKRRIAIS